MKTKVKKGVILGILLLIVCRAGLSQGFVNLDFESANRQLTDGALFPPYSVATTNALPGWSVFCCSTPQTQVTYNGLAVSSTFVTLWATNGQQISGNYSVLLQGGLTAYIASISQSGLVPVSTESLLFEASTIRAAAGSLLVSLGGQSLNYSAISSGANYTLYGADISAYAGQTEQLTFSALVSCNKLYFAY